MEEIQSEKISNGARTGSITRGACTSGEGGEIESFQSLANLESLEIHMKSAQDREQQRTS